MTADGFVIMDPQPSRLHISKHDVKTHENWERKSKPEGCEKCWKEGNTENLVWDFVEEIKKRNPAVWEFRLEIYTLCKVDHVHCDVTV